jgi:glycosyltransferase involved in cell wall biosynthesis
MLLLIRQGKRVIYDIHEYYAQSMLTKSWIPSPARRVFSGMINLIERFAASKMTGIITVNQQMEAEFRKRNPNTIAIANYPPQWFIDKCGQRRAPIPNRIIYCGLVNEERGYQIIFDAMRLVRLQIPQAHCLVIGPIEESQTFAKHPRLSEVVDDRLGVIWGGNIQPEEVPVRLQTAQVCWLPLQSTRRFEDSEPIKLFEYMAAGCPIVASRLGSVTKIVEKTGCGILVSPSDAQSHANAIYYLLTHPKEAAEMGLRGQQAVEKEYNWASQEHKLLTFYDKIVSSG